MSTRAAIGALLFVGFGAYGSGLLWLQRADTMGPPRRDIELPGGTPATFWLPSGEFGPFAVEEEGPSPARLPAVVLMHGYSGDRVVMSALARRLASADHAVLALDMRGHGAARGAPEAGTGTPESFEPDIAAALRFLRASRHVDPERISLVGHSMGARAALAHATTRGDVDAVVLIAGGWLLEGRRRPPNVLFLYAERDLPTVPVAARRIVAKLSGNPTPEMGRLYGNFAAGTALRFEEVPGTRHASIVRSASAAAEVIAWLDRASGREDERPPPAPDSRARPAGLAFLGLLLLLPLVGGSVAKWGDAPARPKPIGRPAALGILGGALLAALPAFHARFPGVLFGASDADRQISYLTLAGLVALAWLRAAGRWPVRRGGGWLAPLVAGVLGAVAVYLMLNPVALAVRSLGLTPARAALAAGTALWLFPLALTFNALLRCGGPFQRVAWPLAGRVVILAALALGIASGAFAGERVVLRALLATYALVEMTLAGYSARASDPLPPAALESVCVGWILSAILPIAF